MKHTDLNAFMNGTAGLGRMATLFQERGLRGFLLHLYEGESIPEHQTRGAISVQCLRGEAIFSSAEEQVTLTPAALISLPGAAPHSVTAREETLLLVTLSEQINEKSA